MVTVGEQVGRHSTPARRRPPRFSSVQLKFVMAVTGAILVLYLVAHMLGNLKIFFGEQALNTYAHWLRLIGEPALPGEGMLWLIRIVLLVAVIAHIVAATILARRARAARPVKYAHRRPVSTTYASRTMRWGGVIVGLFVIYHILDLTMGVANPEGPGTTPYDRLVAGFSNPLITAVYVIALILLGMHLRHGIWSATQTLGQSNKRREKTVNLFALAFSVVLIGGFLLVPFSVLFGLVG
jgi:succinate dehydrogenase / fumarate reductase cytochrome b subunit